MLAAALLAAAESHVAPLARWESFYVIVGSSGAALTGLQFVVITLIAESRRPHGSPQLRAFGTPTIVHFCAVLLLSAIASAPWDALSGAAVAFGLCGVVGVAYVVVIIRWARSQSGYVPVLEDWIWHAVLPFLAYAALVHGGWSIAHGSADTLYVIGAATLLLLFIGIHNAWDTVMYITITGLPEPEPRPAKAPGKAPVAEAPASGEPPHSARP